MAVRTSAVPPMPWAKTFAEPQIDQSAYVHSFSNLVGDVRIGANVIIAPGTSIRAEAGAPFHIGDRASLQDGVVVSGLDQGRVLGADGQSYSVWIGAETSITHMALIHGPAYLGDQCFIGFRSTVFNARVNEGCIVMMHCLIQDVEIPPGKYVPSGSMITTQQQADRLPDVQDRDRQFAAHVVGINDALRSGYHSAESVASIAPIQPELNHTAIEMNTNTSGSLDASVVNHVRQLLSQGYRIGTEHANPRHFQISSWKSCAMIQSTREAEVLGALKGCLADHAGDYVRLIGIDPKAKRRVLETIIQRPDGKPVQVTQKVSYAAAPATASASGGGGRGQGLSADVIGQIRQLLAQGAKIGMEHADPRRYRTSSWTSCKPIQSTSEGAVISALQACMAEHVGEYVRVIGIDPQAKRRLAEITIQRPGDQSAAGGSNPSTSHAAPASAGQVASGGTRLGSAAQQVGAMIAQGCTIGLEMADERRFKIGSWTSAGTIPARSQGEAIAALESFIASNSNQFIRVVGIDPKAKRRVAEVVVHRPGQSATANAAPTSYGAPSSHSNGSAPTAGSNGKGKLNGAVADQVRQLLTQSYKIGVEYADERRYKACTWQTGKSIAGGHESSVMAALESFLGEHPKDYVRLVGIDPKAKRRVTETVIYKPSK